MAIETQKYIRKPLFVDAVRITNGNFDEIVSWCQGEVQNEEISGEPKKFIKVRVHNPKNTRQTKAFVGDWLLYTERGYKVYTNKAFHASFDEYVYQVEEMTTIPATPENIAQAVQENEDARAKEEQNGKRILTVQEQVKMSRDEVRDLVQSGEVVLAQDLP